MSLFESQTDVPHLTVQSGNFLAMVVGQSSIAKYSSVCVHAYVFVYVSVYARVCEGFGGTIYLQLSLWEMSKSNREGRGAWEDLHSASCVILFLLGL